MRIDLVVSSDVICISNDIKVAQNVSMSVCGLLDRCIVESSRADERTYRQDEDKG